MRFSTIFFILITVINKPGNRICLFINLNILIQTIEKLLVETTLNPVLYTEGGDRSNTYSSRGYITLPCPRTDAARHGGHHDRADGRLDALPRPRLARERRDVSLDARPHVRRHRAAAGRVVDDSAPCWWSSTSRCCWACSPRCCCAPPSTRTTTPRPTSSCKWRRSRAVLLGATSSHPAGSPCVAGLLRAPGPRPQQTLPTGGEDRLRRSTRRLPDEPRAERRAATPRRGWTAAEASGGAAAARKATIRQAAAPHRRPPGRHRRSSRDDRCSSSRCPSMRVGHRGQIPN